MIKPLIILDRDGVINFDSDNYIKSVEEWIPIDSSLIAIARLTQANYNIAVATNQSGLSRGYFDLDTLDHIHKQMCSIIKQQGGHIDAIEFCPDHPDKAGADRKPAPGMVLRLLKKFEAEAKETWFVGDTLSDMGCAINADCKPALVLTGKGTITSKSHLFDNKIPVFNDLLAFTDKILS